MRGRECLSIHPLSIYRWEPVDAFQYTTKGLWVPRHPLLSSHGCLSIDRWEAVDAFQSNAERLRMPLHPLLRGSGCPAIHQWEAGRACLSIHIWQSANASSLPLWSRRSLSIHGWEAADASQCSAFRTIILFNIAALILKTLVGGRASNKY